MKKVAKMESDIKLDTPVMVSEGVTKAKQIRFVSEYVKDWNGAAACVRAGYASASAKEIASELLTFPHIKAAVARRMEAAAAAAEVDAAFVVKELFDVATADARELVEIFNDCCRCCYGIGGQRQYTRGEYADALDAATAKGDVAPPLAGGIGYNGTLPPNPDCTECFGRGEPIVRVKDTRTLSPKAAKLYAGAMQTRDGIKSIAKDQAYAIQTLARYTGVAKDKTELSGPGGGPIAIAAAVANVAVAAISSMTDAELEQHLLNRGMALPPKPAQLLEASND
jgi:phage terminase small subunit